MDERTKTIAFYLMCGWVLGLFGILGLIAGAIGVLVWWKFYGTDV